MLFELGHCFDGVQVLRRSSWGGPFVREPTPIALNLDDVWEVFLDHLRRQMEAQNELVIAKPDEPEPQPPYMESGAHEVMTPAQLSASQQTVDR